MSAPMPQRSAAVRQILASFPDGLTCRRLSQLLDPNGSVKLMQATLTNMAKAGQLTRIGTIPYRFALTANANELVASRYRRSGEARRKPRAPAKAQPLSPARADHARVMAAQQGVAAVIPPATAKPTAETVEQWMARTGKHPQVLQHNFDSPRTTFPGRRPSMPRPGAHA